MKTDQWPILFRLGKKTQGPLTIGLLCCLASGCITEEDRHYNGAMGANDIRYHSGFKGLIVPPVEAINNASPGHKRFNQSMDVVWKACLEVVSQYQGIVSVNKSAQGRTICAIKGIDAQMSPTDQMTETTFGSYYDQWLVIAVFEDSGGTGVSIAIIDPVTGQVRPSASAEQTLFSQVQIQLDSTENWREKFTDINWQKRPTRFEASIQSAKPMPPPGFEAVLGNWIAKRLRLEMGVVSCPEVTQSLEVVAQRLKDAAGIPGEASEVHILASSSINAFALPNGQIYVTSGLLDAAQSVDQVAAVLAHEIDHLKNQDVAEKLRKQAAGDAEANELRFAWGIAQMALAFAPGGDLANTVAQDVGRTVGQQTVDRSTEHLQIGMVEDFSEEIELRADEHGCETLYLAGFNPEANLSFLAGLKSQQSDPKLKKSLAMSNFVNLRPGLDKRIERMQKTLDRIRSTSPDSK